MKRESHFFTTEGTENTEGIAGNDEVNVMTGIEFQ
jgi:hypothetical protein